PASCAPTGTWATRSRRTARRTGATPGRCSTSARSASSRGTSGEARAGAVVEQGDAGSERAAAGPADAPVVQLGRRAVQGDDVRVQQPDVRQAAGHLPLGGVQFRVRRLDEVGERGNGVLNSDDVFHGSWSP